MHVFQIDVGGQLGSCLQLGLSQLQRLPIAMFTHCDISRAIEVSQQPGTVCANEIDSRATVNYCANRGKRGFRSVRRASRHAGTDYRNSGGNWARLRRMIAVERPMGCF